MVGSTMEYIHYGKEEYDADAKMPAANKPDAERFSVNWAYYQGLQIAGVKSPEQKSFQTRKIEFPGVQVMAQLSKYQWDRRSPEDQKLLQSVNPGFPNVVFDLESALSLGFEKEDIANSTLEELLKRKVRILAVNYSLGALKSVVGGKSHTFRALTKRDDHGTTAIHRECMIVVFSYDTDTLLSLEVDENAEARLATLRTNATDNALGNIFLAFLDPNGSRCLATFDSLKSAASGTGIPLKTLHVNARASTLGKLGKKHGVSIQRLKDRSEYQALKRIMAKNTKVSPKSNPELMKRLVDFFAKHGEQAKDQKAFLNEIEKEFDYPVRYQQNLFLAWWTKKAKSVKKNTGDIKSYFTSTKK